MYVFNGIIIANSKKHSNEKIKFWQKKQPKRCETALSMIKCCEISQKRVKQNVPEGMMAAAAAFVATNIDDIFVLMLLFAQAETIGTRLRIAAGQYLGIGLLTAASVLAAVGLGQVPGQYLRLLGVVPVLLAVRAWREGSGEENDGGNACQGVFATAALTVANGGDNLGVYIPLFTGYSGGQMAGAAAVFALMTGLWCLLAVQLAKLPAVQQVIRRWKRYLVPAVLFVLGISILLG